MRSAPSLSCTYHVEAARGEATSRDSAAVWSAPGSDGDAGDAAQHRQPDHAEHHQGGQRFAGQPDHRHLVALASSVGLPGLIASPWQ